MSCKSERKCCGLLFKIVLLNLSLYGFMVLLICSKKKKKHKMQKALGSFGQLLHPSPSQTFVVFTIHIPNSTNSIQFPQTMSFQITKQEHFEQHPAPEPIKGIRRSSASAKSLAYISRQSIKFYQWYLAKTYKLLEHVR